MMVASPRDSSKSETLTTLANDLTDFVRQAAHDGVDLFLREARRARIAQYHAADRGTKLGRAFLRTQDRGRCDAHEENCEEDAEDAQGVDRAKHT